MNVSQQMTACKRVPTLKEATTVHVIPSFSKQTPTTGENVKVSTVQISSRSRQIDLILKYDIIEK